MAKISDIKYILKNNPELQKEIEYSLHTAASDQKGEKEAKRSQADLLVELTAGLELFHDENSEPYARLPINGHSETYHINSKFFKRWLCKQAWDNLNRTPNSEALRSAINTVEGQAVFSGKEIKLYNRVTAKDGAIWYDLSNNEWQTVKITQQGWDIINNPPIMFKRYNHQSAQTCPIKGGSIQSILNYVNLKPGQEILFLAYLISCFVPNIPHPVPVLFGERGAAKTTGLKLIKKIVDPSSIEAITFPRDINELVQKLSHHWWIGFDNITSIPDWISDALCRAVTGEGFSKRQLFTDDDDIIYNFRRCIALNGINVVATREDLLDRAILFELERITEDKRKEELHLWKDFEKDRPSILGSIFSILSTAMTLYPKVTLKKLNRMADFTRWGYAIAEALGQGQGEVFLEQYQRNIHRQNEEAINSNPVAVAVIALIKKRGAWEGIASSLLSELKNVAYSEQIDTRAKSFPQSPNSLSRYLNRIKSNLLDAGILYHNKHSISGSYITLTKHMKNTINTVIPSNPFDSMDFANDDNMNILDGSYEISSSAIPFTQAAFDDNDDIIEHLWNDDLKASNGYG